MSKNPIEDLASLHRDKKLERYDYINKMHGYNKTLFYLFEKLKHTDIGKIEVQDDSFLFTTRRDNIKLTFNGVDRRGVPFRYIEFFGMVQKPAFLGNKRVAGSFRFPVQRRPKNSSYVMKKSS